MLHSDEENWRALKTVLIFALMLFWQLIFLLPSPPRPVCLSPSLSPSMRVMRPQPPSPSHAPRSPNEGHPSGRGWAVAVLACTSGKERHIQWPHINNANKWHQSTRCSLRGRAALVRLTSLYVASSWHTQWSSLCVGSSSVGSATLFFLFKCMNLQCFFVFLPFILFLNADWTS